MWLFLLFEKASLVLMYAVFAIVHTQGVGVLRERLTEDDLVSTTLSALLLPSRDLLQSLPVTGQERLLTEYTQDDHAVCTRKEMRQRPQENHSSMNFLRFGCSSPDRLNPQSVCLEYPPSRYSMAWIGPPFRMTI